MRWRAQSSMRRHMRKLIALCGIDGTGKSTQAALLQDRLRTSGHSTEVLWCRWDPLLARPAVWLLDRLSRRGGTGPAVSVSSGGSGDSRRALKRRLLSSRLVHRLWTATMVLDYGLQVAPKLLRARRESEVVIVDRYRYDVLIDLSAGGDLVTTPKVLRWLLPDPDLIVVLDVDEQVALARKPDSPDLTYLEQRRRLYRQLAHDSTAILIDASDSTDVVSESVFGAIASNSNLCGDASK
jgi:thymidylate kinase